MRHIFLLLFTAGTILAQNFSFGIINNFDSSNPEASRIIQYIKGFEKNSDLAFLVFNGLKSGDKDEDLFRSISTDKFFIPNHDEFDWHTEARNNFISDFGDLNFYFDSDSLSVIGLNCSVSWNGKSHFGREELNFLERNVDNIPEENEIILILPDDPADVVNIDRLLRALENKKIRLIISSAGSRSVVTNFNSIDVVHEKEFEEREIIFQKLTLLKDTTKIFQVFSDSTEINVRTIVKNTLPFKAGIQAELYDPDSLIVWKRDMFSTLIGEPNYSQDKILCADRSGRVVCFDTLGDKVWEYFSFGNIYSAPIIRDGFAAVASIQGDLETIDAKTGEAIQSIGFDNSITSNLVVMDYKGPKKIMIPKQTDSKAAVIAGTFDGSLYCYDLETLQEFWNFDDPKGAIYGTPLVAGDQIIFYSADGNIYSIDGSNGWLNWKVKVENPFPIASDPVKNDENIFISVPGDKVYSIATLLGKVNWSHSKYNIWTSLGIAKKGNILFAKSSDNRFHYLSARLGTWVRELYPKLGKDKSTTDIVEIGNSVYFGLEDGYLVRINDQRNVEKILRIDSSPIFSIKKIGNYILASTRNGVVALLKVN